MNVIIAVICSSMFTRILSTWHGVHIFPWELIYTKIVIIYVDVEKYGMVEYNYECKFLHVIHSTYERKFDSSRQFDNVFFERDACTYEVLISV